MRGKEWEEEEEGGETRSQTSFVGVPPLRVTPDGPDADGADMGSRWYVQQLLDSLKLCHLLLRTSARCRVISC